MISHTDVEEPQSLQCLPPERAVPRGAVLR